MLLTQSHHHKSYNFLDWDCIEFQYKKLLEFYYEWRSLIGYATHHLFCFCITNQGKVKSNNFCLDNSVWAL